jgi:hypothetical protein
MSTSFVDFQPKENNNEASESADDELGKDQNSTLIKTVDCLLYKLEEIGDYKIKKNFCESIQLENLQLNDKTFSFSNYLCVVLKTMICPIVIQSSVLFNVNFNGYLKIWINNHILDSLSMFYIIYSNISKWENAYKNSCSKNKIFQNITHIFFYLLVVNKKCPL